jgi:hemerythrin superfamily protein
MKATQLLKKDHATVKQLFKEFKGTTDRARKTRQQLTDRIATALDVHAQIEEEIFYPAMRQIREAAPLLKEAHEEHAQVKSLVAEMQSAEEEELVPTVDKLREAVLHHATEEEREMFPLAEKLGAQKLDELGQRLNERKQELEKGLVGKMKRGVKKAIRKVA